MGLRLLPPVAVGLLIVIGVGSAGDPIRPRPARPTALSLYVEGRFEEAVALAFPAAEAGDASSQLVLGDAYFFGQGLPRDYAAAWTWYTRAADQGHPGAQHALGGMYARGDHVAADDAEAARLYRLAAEAGYVRAQFDLGWRYHAGLGVERDWEQAAYWYGRAADQGDTRAARNLEALSREPNEALEAYAALRQEALLGDPDAQFQLARHFAGGKGLTRDEKQFVHWLRAAADSGHVEAELLLHAIESSRGVSRDCILACAGNRTDSVGCIEYCECVEDTAYALYDGEPPSVGEVLRSTVDEAVEQCASRRP